jgi:NADH/F420H2 dehydrogenase subunit C
MLPSADELKATLEQELPGVSLSVENGVLFVAPKDLAAVCRYLKESERFRLDYAANVTAVDYPSDPAGGGAGRIDMVYHLYSMEKKHGPVALKVKLPRATPVIASVTPIWRGAEFQEREVYDLYGVVFEGHPDLRRILMWDGFEGHPMRKDYVPEDQNVLRDG